MANIFENIGKAISGAGEFFGAPFKRAGEINRQYSREADQQRFQMAAQRYDWVENQFGDDPNRQAELIKALDLHHTTKERFTPEELEGVKTKGAGSALSGGGKGGALGANIGDGRITGGTLDPYGNVKGLNFKTTDPNIEYEELKNNLAAEKAKEEKDQDPILIAHYEMQLEQNPVGEQISARQTAEKQQMEKTLQDTKDMISSMDKGNATILNAPTAQTAIPQESKDRKMFESAVRNYKSRNKASRLTIMSIKRNHPKSAQLIASFGKSKESDAILQAIENGKPDDRIAQYFQGQK